MSIKIRLSRGGRKKVPFYSIVATNSTSPRDSKFLEKLGTFNPLAKKDDAARVVLKKERAEYWLSVGAQPSERVAILLIELGVAGAEKYKPTFTPKEKLTGAKKKTLERIAKAAESLEAAKAKEIEEKAAAIAEAQAAKEAAKAEAEAAKAEAEAAKEAAKAEAEAEKSAKEEVKVEDAKEVKTEEPAKAE
ncbi:MAG: small subunit ribosomal protein S16 [Rickettsiales bacterium]|jgi:small subunit ribosomal protein S16